MICNVRKTGSNNFTNPLQRSSNNTFVFFLLTSQIPCTIVAVFLHYFFLAAFSWMLCEAIMIYIFTVEVFGANDRKWIYMYLLLGWG